MKPRQKNSRRRWRLSVSLERPPRRDAVPDDEPVGGDLADEELGGPGPEDDELDAIEPPSRPSHEFTFEVNAPRRCRVRICPKGVPMGDPPAQGATVAWVDMHDGGRAVIYSISLYERWADDKPR